MCPSSVERIREYCPSMHEEPNGTANIPATRKPSSHRTIFTSARRSAISPRRPVMSSLNSALSKASSCFTPAMSPSWQRPSPALLQRRLAEPRRELLPARPTCRRLSASRRISRYRTLHLPFMPRLAASIASRKNGHPKVPVDRETDCCYGLLEHVTKAYAEAAWIGAVRQGVVRQAVAGYARGVEVVVRIGLVANGGVVGLDHRALAQAVVVPH